MLSTFTIKESIELLTTNPKTFKEWLRKAKIDTSTQINLADPREKYLTRDQLHLLARQHGRTLPAWIDEDEPPAPMTVEQLAEQITVFQQQVTQRLDALQETMLQHVVSQLQEVTVHVQDLQAARTIAPQDASAKAKEDRASQPTSPPRAAPPSRASSKTGRKKRKKHVQGRRRLQKGLVLLRDFAQLHTIAMDRASAATQSGKIAVIRGKWLVNSRWATEALDAGGQHDFYTIFHERAGFTLCEQCPHISATES